MKESRSETVRRWFLEIREPPAEPPPGRPDGADLVHVEKPDLEAYRCLYRAVGDRWQWFARRLLTARELLEILADPAYETWLLERHGVPIGLAELDLRRPPNAELRYFGLVSEWIGRGAGRWFLRAMVEETLGRPGLDRFWLHTCERDHPRALELYLRAGFRVYGEGEEDPLPPAETLLW